MEKFKSTTKKKLLDVKTFLYNSETGQILGRTLLSWGQLLLFFAVFFTSVGSFFAVHLAVFIAITPSPSQGVTPWNFGGYAYPNYPNSRIEMISIPSEVKYNGSHISVWDRDSPTLDELLEAANQSNVTCIRNDNYGFIDGKSCVLIRMAKVFEWSPSSINDILPVPFNFDNFLNITCSVADTNISVTTVPDGLPLKIRNNVDAEGNPSSYPFNNADNYIYPLVGIVIDISNRQEPYPHEVTVKCGFDLWTLGISEWSSSRLKRIYEIPAEVEIKLKYESGNLL